MCDDDVRIESHAESGNDGSYRITHASLLVYCCRCPILELYHTSCRTLPFTIASTRLKKSFESVLGHMLRDTHQANPSIAQSLRTQVGRSEAAP